MIELPPAGGISVARSQAGGRKGLGALTTLPIVFEANSGQVDPIVRFLARGSGYTLFLTSDEAVLALRAPSSHSDLGWSRMDIPGGAKGATPTVLRMRLVGAKPLPRLVELEALPGTVNYFVGDDPQVWRTNVPTYARVRYEGVYPGVDVVYYGSQRQLEYDFIVSPGGDPNVITLEFEGADRLEVDASGDAVLHTPGGQLRLRKPVVYQEIGGQRRAVQGQFWHEGGLRIGFRVGAYDTRTALVIDPVLVYSTYLGGSGNDQAFAVAADDLGNAYLTGRTFSVNFPKKAAPPAVTPYQGSLAAKSDIFVAKVNTNATTGAASLVYSTYVGGSQDEAGYGIAVDGAGNAYVTGQTFSTANFPAKSLKSGNKGVADGFVLKLNQYGSALLYSVYIGGSSEDAGLAIAVDAAGSAHVTGFTTSSNFPTTVGGYDTSLGGGRDGFVAKLNPNGTALMYGTFLGGSGDDTGLGIAVESGLIYVTGVTTSTAAAAVKFPTTSGAYQPAAGAGQDAFVTTLNPAKSGADGLVYSTFLGGAGNDAGNAIAVESGDVYVTGATGSTAFPTTSGAYQTVLAGGQDAFVARLSPDGHGPADLVYSTFLGGSGSDSGNGIDVRSGIAYVTGSTSPGGLTPFPTTESVSPSSGGTDAFVVKLRPGGAGLDDLVYSTLLGGSGPDAGYGIAVDASANAYVVGETSSSNFPTTPNRFSGLAAGLSDAFVAKLNLNTPPVLEDPGDRTVNEGEELAFTLSGSDPDGDPALEYSIASGKLPGMTLDPDTGDFSWTPSEDQGPGVYDVTFRVTDSFGASADKTITITVNEVNNSMPVLTVPNAQTISENTLLTFAVSATDADTGANPSLSVIGDLPVGATFNAATGTFTWKPHPGQGGPNPYIVYFTASDGQFSDTRVVEIFVLDTIPDRDGDGVPDPPGYDLDGNGVISPADVRNALGQFETDNCPDSFNPTQVDVCHNSPEATQAASSIAGPSDSLIELTIRFTGKATEDMYVLPLNLFNAICRVTDNVTGQELQVAGVPEGPPLNLSVGGDLFLVPAGQTVTFTTIIDLRLFFPNMVEGHSHTAACDYVNFAVIPVPEPDDPAVWRGLVAFPTQTFFSGTYTFSGFSSPADHEPFNRGRTVPVKFTLSSNGAPVTTAIARLFLQRLDQNEQPVGSLIPATSNGQEPGNTVPFDAASGQYLYHVDTGPLAISRWQLQLKLDDGSTHVIAIIIR